LPTNLKITNAQKFFPDENFIIPHSDAGLLSMASIGANTNGSQFYITLAEAPYMNGRCVAFGRVESGASTSTSRVFVK
jgi:cyclophilin family peptidyl-prolyl cis-trans isomerase